MMTRAIADEMRITAQEVERHLEEVLDCAGSAPGASGLPGVPGLLREAMAYATFGAGKRLRPFLVLETAGMLGAKREAALDVGAAIELIHCYSLVHDDLPAMDDDDLRRGRPTCHKAFDEATAILAGDGLLTLAFEVLAGSRHIEPERRLELVSLLARAAGRAGMVGGQVLDLAAEKGGARSLDSVTRIQRMKTGALIRFCAEAGAVLAGADEKVRAALVRYAEALGLAFQISDDLLDAEGDATIVGKATGKDAQADKATFVCLLGIEGARSQLVELQKEADMTLASFGGDARVLRETFAFVIGRDR